MSLAEQNYLGGRPEFIGRVRAAMIATAVQVGAEVDDGSNRAHLRRGQSVAILRAPDAFAEQFAAAVAVNAAITFDSADSDIEWTISSLFDAFAGAGPDTTTTGIGTGTGTTPAT